MLNFFKVIKIKTKVTKLDVEESLEEKIASEVIHADAEKAFNT